jgi:hypothetical protein
MSIAAWFRPPRHLVALFVLLTLLPSALLLAFGWRLLQQEKALAERQVEVRRDEVADLAVTIDGAAVGDVPVGLFARWARAVDCWKSSDAANSCEASSNGRSLIFPIARSLVFPWNSGSCRSKGESQKESG